MVEREKERERERGRKQGGVKRIHEEARRVYGRRERE
jgi:hypothetical protein